MVSEMLFASRDLRSYLESMYVGQTGTLAAGGPLRGSVETRLFTFESLGLFTRNPATNQSWWNVTVSVAGDQVTIDYDAYITAPINFIFVTNHFHELASV